ncbi:MAG: hypothetical protein GY771_03265 [bacterium]|nr:hypothetical protein [bacterium]
MKTILAIYLLLAAATTTVTADHVINESENPQFLFVLSAESGSYEGETLTLTGVPSVVYFSDRPYRISGHLSLQEFAENWEEGVDNFTVDPPNATLCTFNDNGDNNVVIELIGAPDILGDSIIFRVRVLLGNLPEMISVSSLFIDVYRNRRTPGVY